MNTQVLQGLLVPFLGTTLGAALVFFLKRDLPEKVQKGLSGFAAGVMVAASIWSLLIPALEGAADLGAWSFLPATIGFWLGILFLLLLDRLVPHVHLDGEQEGLRASLTRSMMVALAVALHNLPEGMASAWSTRAVCSRSRSAAYLSPARSPLPSASPCKTCPKAQLSPCPCVRRA